MRVIVTGSRHATRQHRTTILDAILYVEDLHQVAAARDLILVHGACRGADALAAAFGGERGWTIEAHPAERFGPWPVCGPLRNKHMVSLGADLLLAFPGPGSRGTHDCMRRARAAGIPVKVYRLGPGAVTP